MLAARLRDYRKRRNLSQVALADRSKVDLSNIYRLERGDNDNPTLDTMIRLCKVLNVTPQDIFFPDFSTELEVPFSECQEK